MEVIDRKQCLVRIRVVKRKLSSYDVCYRPSRAGGAHRGRRGGGPPPPPPQSYLLMCPFLLMSPLKVLFLKVTTKNVDENQQAKSRAS